MPCRQFIIALLACACSTPAPEPAEPAEQPAPVPVVSTESAPAAKASGKRPATPRLEGKDVVAVARVALKVVAKNPDQAGQETSCRMLLLLDSGGTPRQIQPKQCDEAYVAEVSAGLMDWRFAPAAGGSFGSPVRVVREVRFTLQ